VGEGCGGPGEGWGGETGGGPVGGGWGVRGEEAARVEGVLGHRVKVYERRGG